MALAPSAGATSPVVTFSRLSLIAVDTSFQVGIGGGAFVSWSCSPKTATFASPEITGSSQALWTAGSTVASSYQATWFAGSAMNLTNAQAASLLGLSL